MMMESPRRKKAGAPKGSSARSAGKGGTKVRKAGGSKSGAKPVPKQRQRINSDSNGRPPAVHTKLQRSHSNNAASDGGGGASAGNAFSETTSREASDAEVAAAAAAQQAMAEQQAAEDASRQQAMAEQQAAEEVLRWEGVLDDPAAEAARLTQYKQDRRNRYREEYARVFGEEAAASAAPAAAES